LGKKQYDVVEEYILTRDKLAAILTSTTINKSNEIFGNKRHLKEKRSKLLYAVTGK
jgi:hypothetical protein